MTDLMRTRIPWQSYLASVGAVAAATAAGAGFSEALFANAIVLLYLLASSS